MIGHELICQCLESCNSRNSSENKARSTWSARSMWSVRSMWSAVWILKAGFWIPMPGIPDSARKNFLDSGIWITLYGAIFGYFLLNQLSHSLGISSVI